MGDCKLCVAWLKGASPTYSVLCLILPNDLMLNLWVTLIMCAVASAMSLLFQRAYALCWYPKDTPAALVEIHGEP